MLHGGCEETTGGGGGGGVPIQRDDRGVGRHCRVRVVHSMGSERWRGVEGCFGGVFPKKGVGWGVLDPLAVGR
eukprot:766747-Hanusia_phi.AAC.3